MVSKINPQALIEELKNKDLLNGMSTAPGRVRTFLLNPERRTTPHSCSLRVYDNNLGSFIRLISQDLRGGSGVKVILDEYIKIKGKKGRIPELKFYLEKEHEDYKRLKGSRYEEDYVEEIEDTDIVIKVADSMDIDNGKEVSIEKSWSELILLTNSKSSKERLIVDLSSLRPSGYTNAIGLTSTGPIGLGKEEEEDQDSDREISSFTDIYKAIYEYIKEGSIYKFLYLLGTINATIRRGGSYKNGIITSSMIYDNPNIHEYLDVSLTLLPGSHKKGICLRPSAITNRELIDKVIDGVNSESLFLSKEKEIDKDKNPFTKPHFNVCMGIKLSDKDTCLIYRNNLNSVECKEPEDIIKGYIEVTQDIIKLHVAWREICNLERVNKIYLPLEKCRQVAIDTMGVANALQKWGVSYKEFVPALESIVQYNNPIQFDTGVKGMDLNIERDIVYRIVKSIARGYQESTRVADEMMESFGLPKLERLHTIEPAQSHSYQIPGEYTTCRGIWPPTFTRVRRLSDTQQNKIYYHGPVETMLDIGTELYERLCNAWQKVMNIYGGRPHGISYDLYTVASTEWLIRFMNSPLNTKYYTLDNQVGLIKAALSNEDNDEEEYLVGTVGTKEECPICAE